MRFNANNFTVIVLLLMALTVFMISVRVRKPLDNNWLLFYWLLMTGFTITRPEANFNLRWIALGLLAGLMLRFEFMNRTFTRVIMVVEMCVFVYVLLSGLAILRES
jgi:hypothetical protein